MLGQIHPLVAQNYGVDAEFYCAELDFDQLMCGQGPRSPVRPLPKFPAVTRDIAVVCGEAVTVGALGGLHPSRGEGTAEGGHPVRHLPGQGRGRGKEVCGLSIPAPRPPPPAAAPPEGEAVVKAILETERRG